LKTIAVDLDDTLNNFSEVLATAEFAREPNESIAEETYRQHLARVRANAPEPSELLSTEYTYLRARIHLRCYELAVPWRDAAGFMQGLKRDGWRIVICTRRDLRRSRDVTHRWLERQGIPYDDLFMAGNKIVFCGLWKIPFLIDDDLFCVEHGARHGVQVFFPEQKKHAGIATAGARPFQLFSEIREWIGA
jgi:hypothetical protein